MLHGQDDEGDLSMLLYWLGGDRLITRDLALSVATQLVFNKEGKSGLDKQLPFAVSETESTWRIIGARTIEEPAKPGQGPVVGAVMIEISKKDCRILSFLFKGDFAVSDEGDVPPHAEG